MTDFIRYNGGILDLKKVQVVYTSVSSRGVFSTVVMDSGKEIEVDISLDDIWRKILQSERAQLENQARVNGVTLGNA